MPAPTVKPTFLVADEAWVSTCLLMRETGTLEGVTVSDIVRKASQEFYGGARPRPGVYAHANGHAVANKRPSVQTGYRMLVAVDDPATGKQLRRPFVQGDPCDSRRTGKMVPTDATLRRKYQHVFDWYRTQYVPAIAKKQRRPGGLHPTAAPATGSGIQILTRRSLALEEGQAIMHAISHQVLRLKAREKLAKILLVDGLTSEVIAWLTAYGDLARDVEFQELRADGTAVPIVATGA